MFGRFILACIIGWFFALTNCLAHVPIQYWQTKNGVPVYFVANKQLPMVDIQVVFNAGSARDAASFGLARFVNAMLNQGTKTSDADQIADGFEKVGAIYSASVDKDMARLSLRSLSAKRFFLPAVRMFSDVLVDPSFPEAAFQRLKKQTLVAIQEEKESPLTLAYHIFEEKLYGNHPYGHSTLGTTETVNRLSVDDLQKFYNAYYVAHNALIAIVGNMSKTTAAVTAEQIASRLASGEAAPALPSAEPLVQHDQQRVNYPSQQTSIFLGQQGIAKKDADYFPLYVGNHILGGQGLTSRLFEEVRNKRGLCYGISSHFRTMQAPGPFYVVLQTRNQQAEQVIAVTRKVLDTFVSYGPTAQELQQAKQNIMGSFSRSLANNASVLDSLVMMGFYHLPLDYLDVYPEKIDSVTLSQIQAAFKRHIRLNKTLTVMLGEKVQ